MTKTSEIGFRIEREWWELPRNKLKITPAIGWSKKRFGIAEIPRNDAARFSRLAGNFLREARYALPLGGPDTDAVLTYGLQAALFRLLHQSGFGTDGRYRPYIGRTKIEKGKYVTYDDGMLCAFVMKCDVHGKPENVLYTLESDKPHVYQYIIRPY